MLGKFYSVCLKRACMSDEFSTMRVPLKTQFLQSGKEVKGTVLLTVSDIYRDLRPARPQRRLSTNFGRLKQPKRID